MLVISPDDFECVESTNTHKLSIKHDCSVYGRVINFPRYTPLIHDQSIPIGYRQLDNFSCIIDFCPVCNEKIKEGKD